MPIENNHIVVCKDKYENEGEFLADVISLIDFLTRMDYEVLVRFEDCGVYVLELAYDPHKIDCDDNRFMKVTADEERAIICNRESGREATE